MKHRSKVPLVTKKHSEVRGSEKHLELLEYSRQMLKAWHSGQSSLGARGDDAEVLCCGLVIDLA